MGLLGVVTLELTVLSGVLPASGRREFQTWGAVATRCDLLDTGVALFPLFPGLVRGCHMLDFGLHAGPSIVRAVW